MIRNEKEPGFAGFFFLGLLSSDTGCHPCLAQNWNISGTFFLTPTLPAFKFRALAFVASPSGHEQKFHSKFFKSRF
ncbi:MAG TPA: hypothetical protein VGB09_09210, partial [Candidatus Binatia bacterium]